MSHGAARARRRLRHKLDRRNFMKKIACCLLAALFVLTAFGCTGTAPDPDDIIQTIDPEKEQIYVSVYNGGTGTRWIKQAAEEFNAAEDKYQVYIIDGKSSATEIIDAVSTGSTNGVSCYFSVDAAFQELIYTDKLVDLSSLLARTASGETRTIGDKLKQKESWLELASKNGEGCYLLPYSDSVGGLVFDFDDFVANGWLSYADGNNSDVTAELAEQGIEFENQNGRLFYKSGGSGVYYEEGERILHAGKDGKFGTYDDGQPQTVAEWNNMLGRIKSTSGSYPFIWPGDFLSYTGMVQNAVFAQLAGIEAFENYFAFDSKGKEVELRDGTKKVITPDNGYDYFKMKEIYQTIEFMNTYFTSDNAHPSTKGNTSHYDAQKNFLYAPVSDGKIANSAMICEGIWWENEAKKSSFPQVEQMDSSRGYGKRDYRFMLLPNIEGQKGIDGKGHGSVVAGQDTGSFFVVKEKNTEKTEVLLDFLVQTLSDDCLEKFTVETGVVRAFDYTVSEENLQKMTPFSRNVWNMYNDPENIAVVRPFQERLKAPVVFATDISLEGVVFPFNDSGKIMGSDTVVVSWLEKNKTVQQIFDMVQNSFSQSAWNGYMEKARAQGFYAA